MRKTFLPFVLLAIVLIFKSTPVVSAAGADPLDPIVERLWLEDTDSAFSPQQALNQPWKTFDSLLTSGLTRSTIWVRLLIDPSRAAEPSWEGDSRLVLNMLPVHLDEIAVFQVDRLDQPPLRLGDQYLKDSSKEFYQNTAVFMRTAPFEVLLRIRSQANLAIIPSVSRWDSARDQSWLFLESLSFFVLTLFFISIASFLLWLDSRERSVLFFTAQQIMGLLVCIYLHGLYQLSDIDWFRTSGDRITSIVIPSCAFMIGMFHTELLKELGARAKDIKFVRILVFGFLVPVALTLLGMVNFGLRLHHILAVAFLVSLNAVAWRFEPKLAVNQLASPLLNIYLRFSYFLMALLPTLQFVRVLSGINSGVWTLWAYSSVLLIGSLLMGVILLTRHYKGKIWRASDALRSRLEHDHVAAQSDLIAMLAHELKTPLSVISLALSSSKDQTEAVERARRGVVNMRNVLDHCEKALAFDHTFSSGAEHIETQRVEVGQLVSELVDGYENKQRIMTHIDESTPACVTDPGMLRIVAGNMIENALKYSPLGSVISIEVLSSLNSGAPCVALRVSNEIGSVGRPDPQNLFKKYYRSSSARHQSGSGLGLYLSQRMAIRFGATLRFLEPHENIVFEVLIPLRFE